MFLKHFVFGSISFCSKLVGLDARLLIFFCAASNFHCKCKCQCCSLYFQWRLNSHKISIKSFFFGSTCVCSKIVGFVSSFHGNIWVKIFCNGCIRLSYLFGWWSMKLNLIKCFLHVFFYLLLTFAKQFLKYLSSMTGSTKLWFIKSRKFVC